MVDIRDYRSEDFGRVLEIDHEAFSSDLAYSHVELLYYVRCRECKTLVAVDDNRIVGFVIACTEPNNLGHIITIDVEVSRQRMHVGSQLLGSIESWLWEKGAKAIYLETPATEDGAFGFYDRHGYFVFEKIPGYYNGSIDALLMMKTDRRA